MVSALKTPTEHKLLDSEMADTEDVEINWPEMRAVMSLKRKSRKRGVGGSPLIETL